MVDLSPSPCHSTLRRGVNLKATAVRRGKYPLERNTHTNESIRGVSIKNWAASSPQHISSQPAHNSTTLLAVHQSLQTTFCLSLDRITSKSTNGLQVFALMLMSDSPSNTCYKLTLLFSKHLHPSLTFNLTRHAISSVRMHIGTKMSFFSSM